MNELLSSTGLLGWKPVFAALLLPPVPWLVLMLVGAWFMRRRRGLGWTLLLTSMAGMWLCSTAVVAEFAERQMISRIEVLDEGRVAELQRQVRAGRRVAIVVLGGGRHLWAPEFQRASLTQQSMIRLHYGVWLARQTGAPLMFSGGVGHGARDGPGEADIAARVAEREYQKPLRWIEGESRDTKENAVRSVALLTREGIAEVVVVTHGWHMPRALAMFEWASARQGVALKVTAAPMGLGRGDSLPLLRWLPSTEGISLMRAVLREFVGLRLST